MKRAAAMADHDSRPKNDDIKTSLDTHRHQVLLGKSLRSRVIISPVDMRVERSLLGNRPGFASGIIGVDRSGVDQSVDFHSQARLCNAASDFNLVFGIFFPGR